MRSRCLCRWKLAKLVIWVLLELEVVVLFFCCRNWRICIRGLRWWWCCRRRHSWLFGRHAPPCSNGLGFGRRWRGRWWFGLGLSWGRWWLVAWCMRHRWRPPSSCGWQLRRRALGSVHCWWSSRELSPQYPLEHVRFLHLCLSFSQCIIFIFQSLESMLVFGLIRLKLIMKWNDLCLDVFIFKTSLI